MRATAAGFATCPVAPLISGAGRRAIMRLTDVTCESRRIRCHPLRWMTSWAMSMAPRMLIRGLSMSRLNRSPRPRLKSRRPGSERRPQLGRSLVLLQRNWRLWEGAAGRVSALTALLLPDRSCSRQRRLDVAEAEKELRLAAPEVRFHSKVHTPPLPDGSGGFFYALPPKSLKDVSAKAVSAVRRDLMTPIVAVGRELAASWPRVVLGHGQGGLWPFWWPFRVSPSVLSR